MTPKTNVLMDGNVGFVAAVGAYNNMPSIQVGSNEY